MQIDWARLIPAMIGAYFVGIGTFGVLRQRIPLTMTRGFQTSVQWRTGRFAVLVGVWCLVLGVALVLYGWLR